MGGREGEGGGVEAGVVVRREEKRERGGKGTREERERKSIFCKTLNKKK